MIIVLNDGTAFEVEESGAYYATSTKVTADTFDGNTEHVTIDGEQYEDMAASDISKNGSKYQFKLEGVSSTDRELDDVITALFELAEIVGGLDG